MTDSGSMTNPSEAIQPCPFCGSTEAALSDPPVPWLVICAECGAEGPYADKRKDAIVAWNSRAQQAATPAAPVQDDDAEIERIALAMAQEIGWGTFSHFNPDDMRRLAKAAANARLTPDRVTPLVEALRKCRGRFYEYADSHKAKNTPEGDAKAARNMEMAEMCSAVLREGAPDA